MKSDANKQSSPSAGDTPSEGGKAQKNKTILVVVLLGCGGLLLLVCCAGGGIGGWRLGKKIPRAQAKTKATSKPAQGENKPAKGENKYKGIYDKIQLGMNNKQIEALARSRGEHIVPADMPRLTDKTLNPLIGKGLRENDVNLLWRWRDAGADDELVIGYQTFDTGDFAVFKAYFHVANNQNLIEYKFDKSVVKK